MDSTFGDIQLERKIKVSTQENPMANFKSTTDMVEKLEGFSDSETHKFSMKEVALFEKSQGYSSLYSEFKWFEDKISKANSISEIKDIYSEAAGSDLYIIENETLELNLNNMLLATVLNQDGCVRIGNSIHIFRGDLQIVILDGDESKIAKASKMVDSQDENIVVHNTLKEGKNMSNTRSFRQCQEFRGTFGDGAATGNSNNDVRLNASLRLISYMDFSDFTSTDGSLVATYNCEITSRRKHWLLGWRANNLDNLTWHTYYGVFSTSLDIEDNHGTGWSATTSDILYFRRVFDEPTPYGLGRTYFHYNDWSVENNVTGTTIGEVFECD